MPFLAYQYGLLSTVHSVEDAYLFVDPSQELVSYEDGVQHGFEQIPRAIQKKIILQLPLDDDEKLALAARKEMEQDASSNAGERRAGYPKFEEGYDLIYCKTTDEITCLPASSMEPFAPAITTSLDALASPMLDNMAKIKVGSRIEVYWPEDEEYYAAKVTEIREPFYHIHYDDGEEEWLPLAEHDFLLHEDGRESNVKSQSAKPKGKWSLHDDNDTREDMRFLDDDMSEEEDDTDEDTSPKKGTKQGSYGIPKRVKHQMSSGSTDDGPSKYIKTCGRRLTDDGCIIPKQPLRKLVDGTYAAPPGRHPLGTYFDCRRGLFVYKDKKSTHRADSSTEDCNALSNGQQPIKKRKIFE